VVKWLTDRGIAKGRLVARGYGLTKPLVDNDTEENRQKNRRVVFVLLNPEETTGGDASGAEGTTPAPSSEPVPAPGTPKTAPKGGKQ
ncbi:MAG: OmpA family protein, partial [Deltaproteobacteria bacterium]|nr:OmpA family protein [Deltaproteobacteria bacterium]